MESAAARSGWDRLGEPHRSGYGFSIPSATSRRPQPHPVGDSFLRARADIMGNAAELDRLSLGAYRA